MGARVGKIYHITSERGMTALSNSQVFYANIIIDHKGIVILDRKGRANRPATAKELRKAEKVE